MTLPNIIFLNNSLDKWLYALGAFILSFILLIILKKILHNRLSSFAQKKGIQINDLVVVLIGKIKTIVLLIIALYVGSNFLILSDRIISLIGNIVVIAILIQIAIWGSQIIHYLTDKYKKQKLLEDAASATTFSAIGIVARILLWLIIVLIILDNVGVNINTLVAGLGIGGIAVALAIQNVLADLFASLSIVLDKPFVIGDFIIVDNYLGSVEHIGLKTTRLRSLSGEQLVMSNGDLLKSRIRNYKRMVERRIVFSIGIIYETSMEKLEAIPAILKEIVEQHENVRFDRAHFQSYGDFSLKFEIVYWVKTSDYSVYMDIQQSINLNIFKRFKKEGIEFAYPTQTVFVEKEEEVN